MDKKMRAAVEKRAHEIWESEGCPDGRAAEHWERAKRDVLKGASANLLHLNGDHYITLKRLDEEQKRLVEDYLENVRRQKLVFLLAGKAGVGKSTTINTLLGKQVAAVHKTKPCTMSIEAYEGKISNIDYIVYDTPGLCDGYDKDDQYIRMIKGIRYIDCFWYVTRLDENRLLSDEKRGINLITEDLGYDIWKHAVIVFTHAGNVKHDFDSYLKERTDILRQHIATKVSPALAADIPSVAVDNLCYQLPDGGHWIAELYTVVLERISEKGLPGFAMSLQEDTGKKEENHDFPVIPSVTDERSAEAASVDKKTDITGEAVFSGPKKQKSGPKKQKSMASASPSSPRIALSDEQAGRVKKVLQEKVQDDFQAYAERTGRAALGATVGAAVGAAAVGATVGAVLGPAGVVLGAAVGGVIGGLASLWRKNR